MSYCVPRTWEVRMMPSWKSSRVTGLLRRPPEFRTRTAVFRIYRSVSVVSKRSDSVTVIKGVISIHCFCSVTDSDIHTSTAHGQHVYVVCCNNMPWGFIVSNMHIIQCHATYRKRPTSHFTTTHCHAHTHITCTSPHPSPSFGHL